jgi:hypothetical protein
MSLYLDKKYINLVSISLDKFKWKKMNLANCRCPICGDSEVNENKARGYFFSSDNSYFFKCHNCGVSHNIYQFLEMISPALFKEYCLERFKNEQEIVQPVEIIKSKDEYENISLESNCDAIEDLPLDHKAIRFLEQRKIPKDKWNIFSYTKLFGTFANRVNSNYKLIEDERLLIPIYDEHNKFIGCQGRSFGNQKPKYITLKRDEKIKLVYGLNTVNKSKPIFVVEGPIDSLFLPNAIACLGVGNFLEIREKFPTQDLIFVVDNEPRNKSVVDTIKRLIENNEKVCVFPREIKDKDINDMVLNGLNVLDTINANTHRGPAAMLAFNSWRKC